jgi:hypothetical protein
MGLSRAELAAELWGLLQRQFTEIGIANEDTSGNLKEPIDATLGVFDVAYSDLATGTIADGSERDAINVARYYGYVTVLESALNRVTTSISASAPSVSKSSNWSEYIKNLTDAMERSRQIAAAFLPSDGSWGSGSISLGFVPSATELTEWAEWAL